LRRIRAHSLAGAFSSATAGAFSSATLEIGTTTFSGITGIAPLALLSASSSAAAAY